MSDKSTQNTQNTRISINAAWCVVAQARKLAEVEAERNELLDKLDRAQDSEVRREADALVELLRQEKVRAEAAEAERDALKAKVAQVVSQLTAMGTEPPTSGQMVTPRWSLIQPGVRQELLHLAAFLKGDQ